MDGWLRGRACHRRVDRTRLTPCPQAQQLTKSDQNEPGFGSAINIRNTPSVGRAVGGFITGSAALAVMRSAAAVYHTILPRNVSSSAESALASCLAVSGAGSGIFRFCTPVVGSRSIQGCAAALESLAAARAAISCAPTCARACHGSEPVSRGGAPDPSVCATLSPTPIFTSSFTSSTDPSSSAAAIFLTSSAGATASPSPMLPVTFSTSFMKRLRREPPSEISPLPPSRIPADKERLNASTESMPSSMVPFATKLCSSFSPVALHRR